MNRRELRSTQAALDDFDRIYDFVAEHDPVAASRLLRRLGAAVNLLTHQPRLGHPYVHKRRRLRLLVHGDYLVFYRERPGIVELVRVLNGKQHIPDILDEF